MTEPHPFASLPKNTVAVRKDGVYMTVVSIGTVKGLGDPEFFNAKNVSFGEVQLMGVQDQDDTCVFSYILNATEPAVQGTMFLIAWYLTKYAKSSKFEVTSITDAPALRKQLTRLGMVEAHIPQEMIGDRLAVHQKAIQLCHERGWTLRES